MRLGLEELETQPDTSCSGSRMKGRAATSSDAVCHPVSSTSTATRCAGAYALVDARLVAVSEGVVEVAHEALFREWPRLRGWLEDDAHGRAVRRSATTSADAWVRGGRDPGDLLRGARPAPTLEWEEGHGASLNQLERQFLAASRAASEAEAVRQRRTNRRLRALSAAASLLSLAIIAGGLAVLAAIEPRTRRLRPMSQSRADRGEARPLLLLAREGEAIHPSAETEQPPRLRPARARRTQTRSGAGLDPRTSRPARHRAFVAQHDLHQGCAPMVGRSSSATVWAVSS